MKNTYVLATLGGVAGFILAWSFGAFVNLDSNPANWPYWGRFWIFIVGLVASVLGIILGHDIANDKL